MSQDALSKALGISASAVNHWEKGRNKPDLKNLRAIARVCGVDEEVVKGIVFSDDHGPEAA